MARSIQIDLEPLGPAGAEWLVQLPHGGRMSREQYRALTETHPDLRFERTADGEVLIMPATFGRSGARNAEAAFKLKAWSEVDGTGIVFDSSSGFDLPNGANRCPDAAWVRKSRLAELTDDERDGYLPLCPDFVIEVRSKTDRISALMDKMTEYMDNGARLGWLLDPVARRAYVYRPGQPVEMIDQPAELHGSPELAGFVLRLEPVWNPGF